MKTITEYRAEMLLTLGDTAGRRYSEAQLDSALRQALDRLNQYLPVKEICKVKIAAAEGCEAVLNWCPGPDANIVRVRDAAGKELNAALRREAGRTIVSVRGCRLPSAGEYLFPETALPHRISGLDGAAGTTVPDSLMQTLCTGAAGYAMRIRARSVTEVFGKRPEDISHLMVQSGTLLAEFRADLELRCLTAETASDPWPGPGCPI